MAGQGEEAEDCWVGWWEGAIRAFRCRRCRLFVFATAATISIAANMIAADIIAAATAAGPSGRLAIDGPRARGEDFFFFSSQLCVRHATSSCGLPAPAAATGHLSSCAMRIDDPRTDRCFHFIDSHRHVSADGDADRSQHCRVYAIECTHRS